MDFTLKTYTLLLKKLQERNYTFLTFEQFMSLQSTESFLRSRSNTLNNSNREWRKLSGNSKISHSDINSKKFDRESEMTNGGTQIPMSSTTSNLHPPTPNQQICILRHDVDRLPNNSLTTAKIENELGIKGTYYFRIVPESFDEKIIMQIAELGHEIGYHYEDVDLAWRNCKSAIGSGQWVIENNTSIEQFDKADKFNNELLIERAYESFCKNLEKMREVTDIKTICMHGSPLSKYDNKLVWTKYDYHELGIIGEPYLDIDWNKFGYLTDTGRRWDGEKVNMRDKAPSSVLPRRGRRFRTTFDIIKHFHEVPDKLMITIHPERWTDNWFAWTRQLIFQNLKNAVKRVMIGIKPA